MLSKLQVSRNPCANKVDQFCYVCANFEPESFRRPINESIKNQYLKCYNVPMTNLDKSWVPKSICNVCRINLGRWDEIKKEAVIQPTIWREPKNHYNDCYFCLCDISGYNNKNKRTLKYTNVESVTPAKKGLIERSNENFSSSMEIVDDVEKETSSSLEYSSTNDDPILFDQCDLDDLIRDLNLPKDSSELLASRLKERNFLLPGTKITAYRKRDEMFKQFFLKEDTLVYCNDIKGLVNCYKPDMYKPEDWRLFIDSSKESLKAVLLHNGNDFAAIPIAHTTVMKESYESFQFLLEKIDYKFHKWLICGDFKMIQMVLGLQQGFTKYPCFLCLWDSRARTEHFKKKDWPKREKWEIGSKNIIHESLVDRENILLPPLHIKLGLIKQYVKALDKNGKCFQYLQSKFPNLSDAKIKEGIFTGPDIRTLIKDDDFIKNMNSVEKNAWFSFKAVIENFLGTKRDPNYKTIVFTMLSNFEKLGCLMSSKLHYLFSHLDRFPENNAAKSEEMGERFHQDIKQKERHYQGRWDERMMADYCWSLKRHDSFAEHRRRSHNRSFETKRKRFHKKKEKEISNSVNRRPT